MKTLLSIAALAASLCVAPAAAQTSTSGATSRVVSYADLDLRNAAGVSELERRIRAAVRDGCGTASDADLEGKNEVRRCREIASEIASIKLERAIAAARQSPATLLASQR
jgi:UrcA family protein